jgi:hypothetical protein
LCLGHHVEDDLTTGACLNAKSDPLSVSAVEAAGAAR